MITRSQLNFHETFQPELQYIAKIISLAEKNFRGNKDDISEETGIPTGKQKGKVVPSIKYAQFMGLVDFICTKGIYQLSLTAVGEEVFRQDPYLTETLSQWVCHAAMTNPLTGAPQWSFLVNRAHAGFSQDMSSEFLLAKSSREFGVNQSFSEIWGITKGSYTVGAFQSLEFVEWNQQLQFIEHMGQYDLLFVYGHTLLHRWEQLFPTQQEITALEIDGTLGFAKTFGFCEEDFHGVLDDLNQEGIVSVNRQLFPPTVIRTAKAEDLIDKIYSRLL